ncbi:hypothetical protein [Marispirochaeta aestuarii]|uniref:hypothetical protein n=1 Tax=Marispirochaeta aestuarii TaxID=1963862 RepID=UPI0029C7FCA0|nr:hypothetical protein [Marispirochaeta aestuarii]
MIHILKNHSSAPLLITVMAGIIISAPVLLLMIHVFSRFGVWGALSICVLTDIAAAFLMKEISLKAGMETLIIALFVIIGVKIAPLITDSAVGLFKG